MNKALGCPPIMFADLRPFGNPIVVVRSHEVAEQISKASKTFPYSLPKMPNVYEHMFHITGRRSILGAKERNLNLLSAHDILTCGTGRRLEGNTQTLQRWICSAIPRHVLAADYREIIHLHEPPR